MSANPIVYRDYFQPGLDAQYNILGQIPAHQPILERWRKDSEKARAESAACARIDLSYGDDPLQRLDFFGTGKAGQPLAIFIHGGYWRSQDKSMFSYVAAPYLERGINIAVINYRLAPAVTMDEIVADVADCTAWLHRNAAALDFDAERIFVAGSSAGGHLTVSLLCTDWSRYGLADVIKGGCSLSGLYDLEPIRLCFLNAVVGLDRDLVARNSPLHHIPARAPKLLLSVGGIESDEFQRQQNVFAAAWLRSGLDCQVLTQAAGHHFDMIDRWADPRTELFEAFFGMVSGRA